MSYEEVYWYNLIMMKNSMENKSYYNYDTYTQDPYGSHRLYGVYPNSILFPLDFHEDLTEFYQRMCDHFNKHPLNFQATRFTGRERNPTYEEVMAFVYDPANNVEDDGIPRRPKNVLYYFFRDEEEEARIREFTIETEDGRIIDTRLENPSILDDIDDHRQLELVEPPLLRLINGASSSTPPEEEEQEEVDERSELEIILENLGSRDELYDDLSDDDYYDDDLYDDEGEDYQTEQEEVTDDNTINAENSQPGSEEPNDDLKKENVEIKQRPEELDNDNDEKNKVDIKQKSEELDDINIKEEQRPKEPDDDSDEEDKVELKQRHEEPDNNNVKEEQKSEKLDNDNENAISRKRKSDF